MESPRETQLRLEWCTKFLGVPFCEMRQRSQAALADTERNRREMQPSPSGPLNFKHIDDLTKKIAERKARQKP